MRPSEFIPSSKAIAPVTTEIPAGTPAVLSEDVLPHPNVAGGLDQLPEDFLTSGERLQDELNHAGLDQELPGEDQAPAQSLTKQLAPNQPLPEGGR